MQYIELLSRGIFEGQVRINDRQRRFVFKEVLHQLIGFGPLINMNLSIWLISQLFDTVQCWKHNPIQSYQKNSDLTFASLRISTGCRHCAVQNPGCNLCKPYAKGAPVIVKCHAKIINDAKLYPPLHKYDPQSTLNR